MTTPTDILLLDQSIRAAMVRDFHMDSNLSQFLQKHYLLHWTGPYFQELYYKRGAMINHQDEKYLVLWYNHDIRPVIAAAKVALSFRKYKKDDYNGYVIVRAIE